MKNKLVALFFIVGMFFLMVGCAKLVSTEYERVEVTIIDEYYRETYTQIILSGKVPVPITKQAVYQITVEYNGEKYTIDDRDTYNKYKELIGQTTIGILEIRTYDNGYKQYCISKIE